MPTGPVYHGGAASLSVGFGVTFPYDPKVRLWRVTPTAGSLTFLLPDLDDHDLPTGSNLLQIVNFSATPFELEDSNSLSQEVTVGAWSMVIASCYEDVAGQVGSPITNRRWLLFPGVALL